MVLCLPLMEGFPGNPHSFQLKYNFFFLLGQPSFPGIVRPKEETPIHLYLEDTAARAGDKVLMELDNSILLIIGDS